MSGIIGLELEGCCCAPQPSCMPPFIGGNSCGAQLEIEIDWKSVQRQQWDNYSAYIQCGLTPPNPCCDGQGSGCCSDHRAECDTSIPALVGTYCNGGTLPCDHSDVTATNLCGTGSGGVGCFQSLCNLWVGPSEKYGYKHTDKFRLCAFGYSAEWIPQDLSLDAGCIYSEEGGGGPGPLDDFQVIANPRQAKCNTQIDENTVYQGMSIGVLGRNLDECNCTQNPCYNYSGRTEVTVSNNAAIWRIGGWCSDGAGTILYPSRYGGFGSGGCEDLGNTSNCGVEGENYCKFDKSYCAMASNNLLPLTEGYTDFATITRTYPMGAGAVTFTITTAGTGYTATNKSQLTYVSGGAGAPNPYGAPFIQITSVNGTGGITAVSILTNGAGDKISVGQVFTVTGGTIPAVLTVASVVAWSAASKPWYRIKLRTIPVEQSQLQDDPDDEVLALERCKDLLQVTEDLAHFCKYKDCQALPSTDPCPDPCDDFISVTQPLWLDTNYSGTGFQSDLNFMGRTIQVDGVDVKTPWVTLAFHLKWELNESGVLVRDEILYHCFGTQKEYETFWLNDSGGAWQAQGTAVANKKKLLWLGIRGDPYNIKDLATGEWYTYGDDHYSECNSIQGIRGTNPANLFCPECAPAYCAANECNGDKGLWLPDNSDEVRIKSMSDSTVVLEGRERYHYKYQVLNLDRSSQTVTQITPFDNCCSGLFGYAPTGCQRGFVKVGLDFCNTCNSIYSSNPCPVDYQGTTTCDECCTNSTSLDYAICQSGPPPLPPNPPYSSPIEFGCESGTPDYAMSASWRNGEARNACQVAGGHTWVLDNMPAVSLYGEALNIPGTMYMAPNNFSSENTSQFYGSQQGTDTCGLPCTRDYGLQVDPCLQPCGLQDCGYPSLISSYTLPI